MALAHLGDRRITSLSSSDQLADALVRYCAEFYDPARREALAAQQWTFARNSVALVAQASVTPIGFAYAHTLPTNLLRLVKNHVGTQLLLADGSDGAITYSSTPIDKFKIVGPNLWSDHSLVATFYIQDVTDPDLWTPHFATAVARLLASYLAGPIADNPGEAAGQKRIYETVDLPNAQYYDAVQDGSGENSEAKVRLAGSPLLLSRSSRQYGGTEATDFD